MTILNFFSNNFEAPWQFLGLLLDRCDLSILLHDFPTYSRWTLILKYTGGLPNSSTGTIRNLMQLVMEHTIW